VFAVVYPIADARKAVGAGTDADDALDLAVSSLLRGAYPYEQRTYLNNPITPLPGWIVLAIPFVVLFGRAAYLNVFWLAVWLAVLAVRGGSAWLAALLAALTFVVFPGVGITFVNGSDSFASVVAVSLLLVVVERAPARLAGVVPLVALAVASGVVLSSRLNVVLLLPLLAAAVARGAGLRRGLVFAVVAGVVWTVVSFGPWVVNPAGFSPLHTYGMLGRFDRLVPGFGLGVPLATGVLALVLARRVLRGGDAWLAMALVLTVPVVCGFAAGVVASRQLDFWPLVYGLMATPVWVGAALPAVRELLQARPAILADVAQPPFWRLAPRSASPRRS
jgi:hypothetical protein